MTQNNSFFKDFNYVFDICKEIENNNCSETKTNSNIDFKVDNYKTNDIDFENVIFQDINLCF
jgi:hypothetical protein